MIFRDINKRNIWPGVLFLFYLHCQIISFQEKGSMREKLTYFLFFSKILQNKCGEFLKLQRGESISLTCPHIPPFSSLTYAGELSTGINHYSPCKQVGIGLDLGLLYRTLKHMRREERREGEEGEGMIISDLQWLLGSGSF